MMRSNRGRLQEGVSPRSESNELRIGRQCPVHRSWSSIRATARFGASAPTAAGSAELSRCKSASSDRKRTPCTSMALASESGTTPISAPSHLMEPSRQWRHCLHGAHRTTYTTGRRQIASSSRPSTLSWRRSAAASATRRWRTQSARASPLNQTAACTHLAPHCSVQTGAPPISGASSHACDAHAILSSFGCKHSSAHSASPASNTARWRLVH